MSVKNWLSGVLGFIVGATMMVPGVSGASMAIILGIYEDLILAVSSFRKAPKKYGIFLGFFSISALIGMFLFSTPLSWLLATYPIPTMYFFGGAVFGGIPMICEKAETRLWSMESLIYILVGILVVVLFAMIPIDIGKMKIGNSLKYQAMLVLLGLPAASALVLPGISISHFLLVMGLYENLISAIQNMNLKFLIPLGFGILLGIILVTKGLEYILENYKKESYMVILGFVLGSAFEIFPEISSFGMGVWAVSMGTLGFWCVYAVSQK